MGVRGTGQWSFAERLTGGPRRQKPALSNPHRAKDVRKEAAASLVEVDSLGPLPASASCNEPNTL
jgi:hypothetical protein